MTAVRCCKAFKGRMYVLKLNMTPPHCGSRVATCNPDQSINQFTFMSLGLIMHSASIYMAERLHCFSLIESAERLYGVEAEPNP